jgi:ribosomal protein L37AE/L43A
MTPNESTHAALNAVLSEANAKVCDSCGTKAAVRVGAELDGGKAGSRANPLRSSGDVWFCFECGHEERAVD